MVKWIDENHIYVMTDFGENSLTSSGHPRIIKKWQRGTSIEQATIIFEGIKTDIAVSLLCNLEKGFEKTLASRALNFNEFEVYLLDSPQKLDLPLNAEARVRENLLLVSLDTDWDIHPEYLAGSLLAIDLDEFLLGSRSFKVIFQTADNEIIYDFICTKDFLVLNIMKDISHIVKILDFRDDFKYIDTLWPEQQYTYIFIEPIDLTGNDIFMTEESFISAPLLYCVDLKTRNKTLLKSTLTQSIPENYVVTQNFATSADGTQIPYFEISQRNIKDFPRQTLLTGYGGFQISLGPSFLGELFLTWLNQGGVYVEANIRGGGEYGKSWHQQAVKKNKQKSYEDFAAVAEDLISRGITSKNKLAALGGSNGGLLVGNMLTQYPNLFAAIVCEVPLLDMQRYTSIGSGNFWIEEYGDPNNEADWKFMQKFSPYHNLDEHQDYPAVLFYTATNDDLVTPVHARKMAAKMKNLNIQNVYFYEQKEGGHDIEVNKQTFAFHNALVRSFLWSTLS